MGTIWVHWILYTSISSPLNLLYSQEKVPASLYNSSPSDLVRSSWILSAPFPSFYSWMTRTTHNGGSLMTCTVAKLHSVLTSLMKSSVSNTFVTILPTCAASLMERTSNFSISALHHFPVPYHLLLKSCFGLNYQNTLCNCPD